MSFNFCILRSKLVLKKIEGDDEDIVVIPSRNTGYGHSNSRNHQVIEQGFAGSLLTRSDSEVCIFDFYFLSLFFDFSKLF